ncbi:Transcriptional activator protein FnrA [Nymphon striatum]|nr:Transcriptional activator protein FnrA [Nymphon striatum]
MNKKKNTFFRLVKSKQTCGYCDIQQLCISSGIDKENSEKLNEIVKPGGPFNVGELIYRRGEKFSSLYVIQCGLVKSETSNADGRKQVTGFYFPGDLVEALSSDFPTLQHELFMRMGKKIYHDEYSCLVNRSESAEKRMLCFLTELFKKLEGSMFVSGNRLHLPMAKVDLASYLGLQPETLSRTLKQLQEKGYIINSPKEIEFLDLETMIKMNVMRSYLKRYYNVHTIWVMMILLTLSTYLIGKFGLHGISAVLFLLITAAIKGSFIIQDFMELKDVSFLWRAIMYGWLWTICIAIVITYIISI